MDYEELSKDQKDHLEEFDALLDKSQKIRIGHEGSLGLLALGDIGIYIWRLKQKEYLKNQQNSLQ